MAAIGEAPTLFLRKATGLVKGWSKFDAFLYSFMSVNFVTLGLFFAFSVEPPCPSCRTAPFNSVPSQKLGSGSRHVKKLG